MTLTNSLSYCVIQFFHHHLLYHHGHHHHYHHLILILVPSVAFPYTWTLRSFCVQFFPFLYYSACQVIPKRQIGLSLVSGFLLSRHPEFHLDTGCFNSVESKVNRWYSL